ncbi:hypothetical protein [Amycolatopsis sp. NPDC001319]|uniref:hypothetical protein n=1 Tax=unclassified Amycolatopsis TaxID=2618356 RepID=UPI00367DD800
MSTNPEGARHGRLDPGAAPPVNTTQVTSPPQNTPSVADAPPPVARQEEGPGRGEVVERQRERFGGIKWGAAFFGWLTATGTALILTAAAAAAGTAFGLATNPGDAGQAADQVSQAAQNPAAVQTATVVSAIVVLVVLLIGYYCGGYVAGRMARFNGVKQGLAVWVWSIVIAAVVAILAAVGGSQFDILARLNGLPRLPINEGTLTVVGIITVLVALAAALIGAILGGLAGMRYHRKIDRIDFQQYTRAAGPVRTHS